MCLFHPHEFHGVYHILGNDHFISEIIIHPDIHCLKNSSCSGNAYLAKLGFKLSLKFKLNLAYGIGYFFYIMYLSVKHGTGLVALGFLSQYNKFTCRFPITDSSDDTSCSYIQPKNCIIRKLCFVHTANLLT